MTMWMEQTLYSALSHKTNLLYDDVEQMLYNALSHKTNLLYDEVQSKRYIVHFLLKQTCSMTKYRAKAI